MIKKFLTGLSIIFAFIMIFTTIGKVSAIETNSPHWQKKPIKVYIPKDTYSATMKNAFLRWQEASAGNIKFSFVEKGPADIDVVFAENASGDTPIATYSVSSEGNKITKAEIKIASKSPKFKKYTKNYIYTTMLHEVGHTIGLPDNTQKKSLIMYTPISETQSITKLDIRNLYQINNWSYAKRNLH